MKQARACCGPGENWHHTAHVCMPQLSLSPKDDVLIRTAYWEQTESSLTHAIIQTALRHVWGSIVWVKIAIKEHG